MTNFLQYCSDGPVVEPDFTVIFSKEGKGKTNLASGAPNCVFFDLEKGSKNLNVTRAPELETYRDFVDFFEDVVLKSDISGMTLVIDTGTKLEQFTNNQVLIDTGAKHINDKRNEGTAFGNGQTASFNYWLKLMTLFDQVNKKNAYIIFLAHAQTERFNDPLGEAYDRFEVALHKSKNGVQNSTCNLVQRNAGNVLFLDDVRTVDEQKDGLQKSKKGVGSGARVVYTQERPAYSAKNRHSMPHKIFLDDVNSGDDPAEVNRANFMKIAQYIPWYNQKQE